MYDTSAECLTSTTSVVSELRAASDLRGESIIIALGQQLKEIAATGSPLAVTATVRSGDTSVGKDVLRIPSHAGDVLEFCMPADLRTSCMAWTNHYFAKEQLGFSWTGVFSERGTCQRISKWPQYTGTNLIG